MVLSTGILSALHWALARPVLGYMVEGGDGAELRTPKAGARLRVIGAGQKERQKVAGRRPRGEAEATWHRE